MNSTIRLTRAELDSFTAAASREWLLSNGIGGYASGTVAGANTRRYHGLLVAALQPPLGRTVLVAKLDVSATYLGNTAAFTANEFADGTIAPNGVAQLASFRLEGRLPVWEFVVQDALIEQRIWTAVGENTTYVQFTVLRASAPLALSMTPFCTYRDYHGHCRGDGWQLQTHALATGCEVEAYAGATRYRLTADCGSFTPQPGWYWNFKQRKETARGLDDVEDLFRVGEFSAELQEGESVTLTLSTAHAPMMPQTAQRIEHSARQKLLDSVPPAAPEYIRQLSLAADQFIVARGAAGKTVLAGYPWFGDWGRDTMIALPGLAISTQRYDVAASVLRTFARYVSEGMLPNRFPDGGEAPEYNTVDATLWYFHALDRYVQASGDLKLARELYPVLLDIVEWHLRGTRYGIRVDTDGLLRAGEAGAQLTWMDAKVGEHVITPRIGKPVEINALWYRALTVLRSLATQFADDTNVRHLDMLASAVRRAFEARFWSEAHGYLFDVVDTPSGDDSALRPNQIFAVSLAPELLTEAHRRAVVDVVARELWTPVGLRSLAARDPAYAPLYRGGPGERDAKYHQGTVWSWLLGPFVSAHYQTYGDAPRALSYLDGIEGHLREACIGSISEIFDGAPPHQPEGCFAQAWSVAEVLRAWTDINFQAQQHLPDAALPDAVLPDAVLQGVQ